jgi:protein TonB
MLLCLATGQQLGATEEGLGPFVEEVMGHLRLKAEACPDEIKDEHPDRVTTCASYRSHFSAFKLDVEVNLRRHHLASLATPVHPWTFKGGSYVRAFKVEEKELTVRFDEKAKRVVLIYPGVDMQAGAAPTATREQPMIAGFGGVSRPTVIDSSRVEPEYPPRARERGIEGSVSLEVVIRKDGTVGEVSVLRHRPEGWDFEEAAVSAVQQWRFEPALHDGEPVDAVHTITVDFVAE